ncbi:MAG: hypothetical protein FD123_1781 [Bacteroidetes bacterium]|nr:MAG: hypothetical protein FD123_1781 [Bacteroidota bacterium]
MEIAGMTFLTGLGLAVNSCYYGYVVIVPAFFLLSRLLKKRRELLLHFIHLANLLLASVTTIYIFLFIGGLIRHLTWLARNTMDAEAVANEFPFLNRMTGPYAVFYWLPVLLMVFASLFWFRKIRRNNWATLFAVLLVLDAACHLGIVHVIFSWKTVFRSDSWPADIDPVLILARVIVFPVLFSIALGFEYFTMRSYRVKRESEGS